jgi:RNA polymerase-interacting CarD/CdnL/TRCF family regulator
MVTDEILEDIERSVTSPGTRSKLRDMLQLSDLVKFAKERPLPDEEEKTLNYAIDFVRDTINFIENAETN